MGLARPEGAPLAAGGHEHLARPRGVGLSLGRLHHRADDRTCRLPPAPADLLRVRRGWRPAPRRRRAGSANHAHHGQSAVGHHLLGLTFSGEHALDDLAGQLVDSLPSSTSLTTAATSRVIHIAWSSTS